MWSGFYKIVSSLYTQNKIPAGLKIAKLIVINVTLMKQIWGELKQRIGMMMEQNAATKDRTTGFRITVAALITTALFCIILYLIKTIP
jgi:hypothetical protein